MGGGQVWGVIVPWSSSALSSLLPPRPHPRPARQSFPPLQPLLESLSDFVFQTSTVDQLQLLSAGQAAPDPPLGDDWQVSLLSLLLLSLTPPHFL